MSPQNHRYKDSRQLNDLVERMDECWSHPVVEIQQIQSRIVEVQTSDGARYLLDAQIADYNL